MIGTACTNALVTTLMSSSLLLGFGGAAGDAGQTSGVRDFGASVVAAVAAAEAPGEAEAEAPGEAVARESVVIACPAARVDVHEETFSAPGETRSYTVAPSTNGSFCIALGEMSAGLELKVLVTDHLGNEVYASPYGVRDTAAVVELFAGEVYTVEVAQSSGSGVATISIGHQRALLPLYGEATEGSSDEPAPADVVLDAMSFEGQVNFYVFTAAQDGAHRFDLAEMFAGNEMQMDLYDHLGREVASTEFGVGSGAGMTASLQAEETYVLAVRQRAGLGSYELHLGYARPVAELGEIAPGTPLADQVTFTDETVGYLFTAPLEGTYTFDFSEMAAGFEVRFEVIDLLGYEVFSSPYAMGNTTYEVELEAGETYLLNVTQGHGLGDYVLTIGW